VVKSTIKDSARLEVRSAAEVSGLLRDHELLHLVVKAEDVVVDTDGVKLDEPLHGAKHVEHFQLANYICKAKCRLCITLERA
jgi:hypothetical protein